MHDQWIDVLRIGTFTASNGEAFTFDAADLERIVAATRANLAIAGREPAAVIGHPTTDAPAWGWVSDIKREGDRVWVKFRDLVPEFVEMVRRRMFPHRSIGLNKRDYSIHHVGFLGAKPPAVPGLTPIALADAEHQAVLVTAEEDRTMADKTRWQKLLELVGLAGELNIELPDTLLTPRPATPAATATFSQADVDAATEKARATEREAGKKAAALAVRKGGIVTFCEGLKPAGHFAPAWEKAGIVRFMERLADLEDVVAFAEGADTTQTPLAWFQGFVAGLPKVVHFEEIAAPAKKPAGTTVSDRQREINRQLGIADDVVAKFAQVS